MTGVHDQPNAVYPGH